jgi:hypothetical protein
MLANCDTVQTNTRPAERHIRYEAEPQRSAQGHYI